MYTSSQKLNSEGRSRWPWTSSVVHRCLINAWLLFYNKPIFTIKSTKSSSTSALRDRRLPRHHTVHEEKYNLAGESLHTFSRSWEEQRIACGACGTERGQNYKWHCYRSCHHDFLTEKCVFLSISSRAVGSPTIWMNKQLDHTISWHFVSRQHEAGLIGPNIQNIQVHTLMHAYSGFTCCGHRCNCKRKAKGLGREAATRFLTGNSKSIRQAQDFSDV